MQTKQGSLKFEVALYLFAVVVYLETDTNIPANLSGIEINGV